MVSVLIVYGSTEGQTAKIADHIAGVLRDRGMEARTCDLAQAQDTALGDSDGVLVGASIHMGKHAASVTDFVRRNRTAIDGRPNALFSVSLAAHGDTAEAERYVREFAEATGWQPAAVALFGGALPYTRYGFLKRRMMRRIVRSKPGGLSADTSRDHEYTDWAAVRRFAEDFAARLEPTA